MDKEILNIIVNKKNKRLATLLFAIEKESTFTIEELVKLLSVTKVTVKSDIQELKELFPTQLTVEISESVTILINENHTIFELVNTLLLEDPGFIILLKLISVESFDFYECCRELFISETTLKRYIIFINRYLSRYEIKLSFFPIRFIGSEINIRAFCVKFLETFDYLKIDFQVELITSFCLEFEQKLTKTSLKEVEINFDKLFLWLSTIALRTKKNHFITLSDINLNFINKTYLHQIFKKHLKNSYFLQNIPEIEKKFLYLILWDCVESDFSFLFLEQISKLMPSLKINNKLLQSMQETIEKLFCLTENKTSKIDILYTILSTFFLLKQLSQVLPNYYLLNTDIKNYLLYYHYDFYKKWQQFINNFCLLSDNAIDVQILGLKFTFLSIVNDWFEYKTYKVALDLNIPFSYRWLILSIFKKNLGVYHMDIQSIQLTPSKLLCLLQPYDFLITNYPLKLPLNTPVHFQLCKYPTIEELERTMEKIIQMNKPFTHT